MQCPCPSQAARMPVSAASGSAQPTPWPAARYPQRQPRHTHPHDGQLLHLYQSVCGVIVTILHRAACGKLPWHGLPYPTVPLPPAPPPPVPATQQELPEEPARGGVRAGLLERRVGVPHVQVRAYLPVRSGGWGCGRGVHAPGRCCLCSPRARTPRNLCVAQHMLCMPNAISAPQLHGQVPVTWARMAGLVPDLLSGQRQP
jgi:hypothetical protein